MESITHQEQPILTNEEILALIDVCNELCVTIETHDMCYQPKIKDYPWKFLMDRKNDVWKLLNHNGLRNLIN